MFVFSQCEVNSKDLPFNVCQWILTRPIMAESVGPQHGAPLHTAPGLTYTRIAVDTVQAADGIYNVFFLATGGYIMTGFRQQTEYTMSSSWPQVGTLRLNAGSRWNLQKKNPLPQVSGALQS